MPKNRNILGQYEPDINPPPVTTITRRILTDGTGRCPHCAGILYEVKAPQFGEFPLRCRGCGLDIALNDVTEG